MVTAIPLFSRARRAFGSIPARYASAARSPPILSMAQTLLAFMLFAVTPHPKVWMLAPNWPLGFVSPRQFCPP